MMTTTVLVICDLKFDKVSYKQRHPLASSLCLLASSILSFKGSEAFGRAAAAHREAMNWYELTAKMIRDHREMERITRNLRTHGRG